MFVYQTSFIMVSNKIVQSQTGYKLFDKYQMFMKYLNSTSIYMTVQVYNIGVLLGVKYSTTKHKNFV